MLCFSDYVYILNYINKGKLLIVIKEILESILVGVF